MIEDQTQNLSQQLGPPCIHQKSTANCNYAKIVPQQPCWQRKKNLTEIITTILPFSCLKKHKNYIVLMYLKLEV